MSCNDAALHDQKTGSTRAGHTASRTLQRERSQRSRKSSDEFLKNEYARTHGTGIRYKEMDYTEHRQRPSVDRTTVSTQADIVYYCPRPIIFPYHNDGHFLPLAEPPVRGSFAGQASFDGSPTSPGSISSTSTQGLLGLGTSYSFLNRLSPSLRDPFWGRSWSRSRSTSTVWSSSPVLNAVQLGKKRSLGLLRTLFQPSDGPGRVCLPDVVEDSNERNEIHSRHSESVSIKHNHTQPDSTPSNHIKQENRLITVPLLVATQKQPSIQHQSSKTIPSIASTTPMGMPVVAKLGLSAARQTENRFHLNTIVFGHFTERNISSRNTIPSPSLSPRQALSPTPSPSPHPAMIQPFSFATTEPTIPPQVHHRREQRLKALPPPVTLSLPSNQIQLQKAVHGNTKSAKRQQRKPHAGKSQPDETRPEPPQEMAAARRLWKKLKGFINKSKKIKANRVGVGQ